MVYLGKSTSTDMNRMYQMDKRENYEEKVVYDRVLFCRKENVGELANNMRLYI